MSSPPIPEATRRYTGVAIALHWMIALGIMGMIAGGWYMGDLPDGHPNQYALYQLHKSIGITILLLTVARVVWRLMNPPPPAPESLKSWEQTASGAVHIGFYALMIAMPLTGWFYASVSTNLQVPTVLFGAVSWPHVPFTEGLQNDAVSGLANNVHSKLAWVAIGLLVLHVAGAVKHELEPGEGVLKRMIPGFAGATSKPSPAKGFLPAFGAALAVFVAFAAIPFLQSSATPQLDRTANAPAGITAWAVDYDASEIRFGFNHDGNDYEGVFNDWTASIDFDPANPGAADVSVDVSTGSARTGQKIYDDALPASEWFNVRQYPIATVTFSDFQRTDEENGWTSEADIQIKDLSLTVPFGFVLEIDGDTAVMAGSTALYRSPLNLGMDSDPGGEWVSDEVAVTVKLRASRAE